MECLREPYRGIGAETQFVQDAVLAWRIVCSHYTAEVDRMKTASGVLSDIFVVV